jgi:hypothetical protein
MNFMKSNKDCRTNWGPNESFGPACHLYAASAIYQLCGFPIIPKTNPAERFGTHLAGPFPYKLCKYYTLHTTADSGPSSKKTHICSDLCKDPGVKQSISTHDFTNTDHGIRWGSWLGPAMNGRLIKGMCFPVDADLS